MKILHISGFSEAYVASGLNPLLHHLNSSYSDVIAPVNLNIFYINKPTPQSRVLEKLMFTQLVKELPVFLQVHYCGSQELTSGPSPEPDESRTYSHTLFF
jgi:hypothetical protein